MRCSQRGGCAPSHTHEMARVTLRFSGRSRKSCSVLEVCRSPMPFKKQWFGNVFGVCRSPTPRALTRVKARGVGDLHTPKTLPNHCFLKGIGDLHTSKTEQDFLLRPENLRVTLAISWVCEGAQPPRWEHRKTRSPLRRVGGPRALGNGPTKKLKAAIGRQRSLVPTSTPDPGLLSLTSPVDAREQDHFALAREFTHVAFPLANR